MTALNSTVASVPAREYVFVLTGANAMAGKRGEGGWEPDSSVLRASGQGKLNKNGKLLLGFTEGNKLALLNTFFAPSNVASPSPSKAPAAARGQHVWTMSCQSKESADWSAALMFAGPLWIHQNRITISCTRKSGGGGSLPRKLR